MTGHDFVDDGLPCPLAEKEAATTQKVWLIMQTAGISLATEYWSRAYPFCECRHRKISDICGSEQCGYCEQFSAKTKWRKKHLLKAASKQAIRSCVIFNCKTNLQRVL